VPENELSQAAVIKAVAARPGSASHLFLIA